MKKHLLLVLLCVALVTSTTHGQKIFKSDSFGISMHEPKDWLIGDAKLQSENLKKMDIDDEKLADLLKSNNGNVLLASFYKFDFKTHAGLIPTININVRNNPTSTFEQFTQMIKASSKSIKILFTDFSFIQEPHQIDVNGNKAIFFQGKYLINTTSGAVMKVKLRTYCIPKGKYFFQINFMESQDSEEDTALFDALAKTIHLTK